MQTEVEVKLIEKEGESIIVPFHKIMAGLGWEVLFTKRRFHKGKFPRKQVVEIQNSGRIVSFTLQRDGGLRAGEKVLFDPNTDI